MLDLVSSRDRPGRSLVSRIFKCARMKIIRCVNAPKETNITIIAYLRLRKKLIAEQGVTQNKSANLRAPSIKSNVKQVSRGLALSIPLSDTLINLNLKLVKCDLYQGNLLIVLSSTIFLPTRFDRLWSFKF